jgi:MoaA/NifB/PqqE/SkfB family radical SAM enzyme
MSRSAWIYLKNLVRLWRGASWLHPRVVTYTVTTACNLNCTYCEDFGARRSASLEAALPLADALRLLAIVRRSVDSLTVTGGEPLLYPDIVELITRAKSSLGFRQITLLTNSLLLREFEALLPAVDRLVISLDSTDTAVWSSVIRAPAGAAQTIVDNIRRYARRQGELGYRLIVNCVVAPETLTGAQGVLDLCREVGALASFSPQAVCNWPHYELLVSEVYAGFMAELVAAKRRGEPILGSLAYLRTLQAVRPYECYPTLTPRIMPNGELVYPCRPVERAGGSHGGRPCNVLEATSLEAALDSAAGQYGPPPLICTSCFQQCFMEPSLMQAQPLELLGEWLINPPSRHGGLGTYTPG